MPPAIRLSEGQYSQIAELLKEDDDRLSRLPTALASLPSWTFVAKEVEAALRNGLQRPENASGLTSGLFGMRFGILQIDPG